MIQVDKSRTALASNKTEEVVRKAAVTGVPLEKLRDTNYWISQLGTKKTKTEKKQIAERLMRSQGSLSKASSVENILRSSNMYAMADINAHLDWARKEFDPRKKNSGDSHDKGSVAEVSKTSNLQNNDVGLHEISRKSVSDQAVQELFDEYEDFEVWRNFRIETSADQLEDLHIERESTTVERETGILMSF